MQGPVQDEAGEPCGPAEISPSKEQRNLIFGFYIEKWRAYQDAKRSKEKAAEEEMRRVQVRGLCACSYSSLRHTAAPRFDENWLCSYQQLNVVCPCFCVHFMKEERRRQEIERKKAQQASWTVEELSLLAKALQKFPGGTARRWYHVATYIGTKTQDEVGVRKTES